MNMFNILMSDEEDDDDNTDSEIGEITVTVTPCHKKGVDFKITKGACTPTFHSDKSFLSKLSIFYGRCFLCHSVGHSQRYCSLRWCPRCNAYGHSVMTCVEVRNWKKQRKKDDTASVVKDVLNRVVDTVSRQCDEIA